jgi:small conductance mechanosensitive channel
LDTPDNVRTMIGNNKVLSDTVQNYSTNPFRRVELKVQLAGAADAVAAMELLRTELLKVNNVLPKPAVDAEILEFTLVGPVLAVRPYCHTDHYWQVYFDSHRVIRKALGDAGFPAPMPAQMVLVQQK